MSYHQSTHSICHIWFSSSYMYWAVLFPNSNKIGINIYLQNLSQAFTSWFHTAIIGLHFFCFLDTFLFTFLQVLVKCTKCSFCNYSEPFWLLFFFFHLSMKLARILLYSLQTWQKSQCVCYFSFIIIFIKSSEHENIWDFGYLKLCTILIHY